MKKLAAICGFVLLAVSFSVAQTLDNPAREKSDDKAQVASVTAGGDSKRERRAARLQARKVRHEMNVAKRNIRRQKKNAEVVMLPMLPFPIEF